MSDSNQAIGFVAPDPADLAPLFPGYEIQCLIATGGMGAVYQAVQKSLDRAVALKILPRELSKDAAFCAGFEAEAKAMARLNHPNLIGVYDFGEVNGMLYIIMEYVPGKSVYHSAYGKSIAPKEVIRLVTGICKGLAHAHENGILHRDIKPSNILLDQNAEPKIGDFGLARPIDTKVVEGEEIFGTPHYTAPEVVNSPHSVDYRADIFSVGVLLHELLTGKLPAADSRPASVISHCDTRFDAIIRKATQPLAASRYSSAMEIANDLQAIITSAAVGNTASRAKSGRNSPARAPAGNKGPARNPAAQAHRSSGHARPFRPPPANKSSGSPVIFLLVLLVAAAAAYFLFIKAPPPQPQKPKATDVPVTSIDKEKHSPTFSEEKSSNATSNKQPPLEDKQVTPDSEITWNEVTPSQTPPPAKIDIPALLERARKVLRDRAKPAINSYNVGLKDNYAVFVTLFRRQVDKYKPGLGPSKYEVDAAIEEWKTAGGKVPESLSETLSGYPELVKVHTEFLRIQIGVKDTFDLAISQISSSYLQGLQKQIELRKADNDPGSVLLIENEITASKDSSDYVPELILGTSSDKSE